jgi:hypothetical protein
MTSDFKIKFDGQQHQVDANVLINSLIHTTNIVQEVNRCINSDKKIELKVKALEKGSFLCHIELVETSIDVLKNIFTKEGLDVDGTIISTVVALIEIKRFLGGSKPKKIEKNEGKTTITNTKGDVFIIENATFNIYENNNLIRDAMCQNFDVLNNDPSITGFEITDKNEKPLVSIQKNEFDMLATKSEDIGTDERNITEAATLNIVRLSFEENLKWDFYYKGIKISAKITDPDFYILINKGEKSFTKGDVMQVELKINQKFDSSVNTFITKSYEVTKIYKHLLRHQQHELNYKSE